jgi:hypothetical protein
VYLPCKGLNWDIITKLQGVYFDNSGCMLIPEYLAVSHVDLLFVCFCFESHEQFFSYLATVTITSDRAANLDLCLALMAFSSEGSFTCHTNCDTGPPF